MRRLIPVFLIAVAALVGFFGYRMATGPKVQDVGTPITQAPGAVQAEEEQLAVAAPTVPDTLPDFSLTDRDGQKKTLADWNGHPRIVNFWATWCQPCRREIPLLQSLREERKADGLEVIGIAIDNRDDVLKYADKIGIKYPLLIGDQDGFDGALAFGVNGVLPFSVFADSKGRVAALKVGELKADQAAFILDTIRDVDQGHLDIATAKSRIESHLRGAAESGAEAPATPAAAT